MCEPKVNPHHGDARAANDLGGGQRREGGSRNGHSGGRGQGGSLCGSCRRGEKQRGGRWIGADAAGVRRTGGHRAKGISGHDIAQAGTAAMAIRRSH